MHAGGSIGFASLDAWRSVRNDIGAESLHRRGRRGAQRHAEELRRPAMPPLSTSRDSLGKRRSGTLLVAGPTSFPKMAARGKGQAVALASRFPLPASLNSPPADSLESRSP